MISPQAAARIAQNQRRKTRRLTLPVLTIAGADNLGEAVGTTMRLAADDVEGPVPGELTDGGRFSPRSHLGEVGPGPPAAEGRHSEHAGLARGGAESAVDRDVDAVDESGLGTGQEGDDVGDFPGLGRALHGDALTERGHGGFALH